MDITIQPEIAVVIGLTSGALIIAFLTLLVWFVKHLTSFAKALNSHTEVNAALNDELLETVKGRRADRDECNKDREEQSAAFETQRSILVGKMATLRTDSERANQQLGAELVKVKGQLTQAHNERDELKRANEHLQLRVTTLEREGQDKDRKIKVLSDALDVSEQNKNRLADQVENLMEVLNGKEDKPTAESGEHTAPAPEQGEPKDETKVQEATDDRPAH